MGVQFSSLTETNDSSVLLVDGLNLAFRWRDFDEFATEYIRTVKSLAKSYKTARVIIAADQGSSSFRKTIYPEYKANRKEKYEQQTPEEREQFERFFNHWEELLLILEQEFTVLRFPGVEADDIAAYIVKNRKQFSLEQIWLISSDRDWNLLVTEGVSQFSYVTRKETTADNWSERHDCEPEQYADLKALMGDSGDNILGVAGIGPKRALALIQEYGSVLDIVDALPLPGKSKYIQNLNASKELLELNLQLVDLLTFCEEAVGEDNCKQIDEVFQ